MAVEIKSGNSTDIASVDPISKSIRATLYNSAGVEGTRELPVTLTVAPVTTQDDDIISSIDVSEYKFVSLQLTGTWVGTVQFQGSNDNGTFYAVVAQDPSETTNPYSNSSSSNNITKIPVLYKYLRARVIAYTSGTVTGVAYGHKEENSSGLISALGSVSLNAETTKVIGTVNVSSTPNSTSGTINAADTAVIAPAGDGALLSGTPSIGSYVALASDTNDSAWSVELSGTLDGSTFYFEGSTSSTTGIDGEWTSLNGTQTGIENTVIARSANSAGDYRGNAAGLSYFRVRAVGGVGINTTVNIRMASGTGAVFLNASIPAGTNTIGSVALNAGTTTIGKVDLNTGTNTIGKVDLNAGTEYIGNVVVIPDPNAPPYQTDFYVTGVGAVDVNSRMIRTGACHLISVVMTSYAATPRHIKLYDTASTPTAGAGTPTLVLTRSSSGNNSYPLPAGGFPFVNGIGMTFVQGAANNNATGTATVDASMTAIFT